MNAVWVASGFCHGVAMHRILWEVLPQGFYLGARKVLRGECPSGGGTSDTEVYPGF